MDIQFSWMEWRTRYRALDDKVRALRPTLHPLPTPERAHVLVAVASEWYRDAVAWLRTLDDEQRDDVVRLLSAECDMLWNVIDPAAHAPSNYFPSKPEYGGDEWGEFRERWFAAACLLRIIINEHFPNTDLVEHAFIQLEQFAMKKEWLP